jgi:hypothetical protein
LRAPPNPDVDKDEVEDDKDEELKVLESPMLLVNDRLDDELPIDWRGK